MVEVCLHGILAKRFKSKFKFKVNSIKEAFLAISSNHPDFKKFLVQQENLFLKVVCDGKNITQTYQNLTKFKDVKKIDIVPVIIGSFSKTAFGLGQIFAGVSLIVLGAFFAPPLILGGIALLAQGIVTLLTPTPKFKEEEKFNLGSNIFSGSNVTTVQGDPVPLIYGKLKVEPFTVCSDNISLDDQEALDQAEDYEKCDTAGNAKCYITTAACNFLDMADKGDFLNTIRNFRDNFVQKINKSIVDKYYEEAPQIVNEINKNKNKDKIYKHIFKNYLLKCFILIKRKEKIKAYLLYKKMVKFLNRLLLK